MNKKNARFQELTPFMTSEKYEIIFSSSIRSVNARTNKLEPKSQNRSELAWLVYEDWLINYDVYNE